MTIERRMTGLTVAEFRSIRTHLEMAKTAEIGHRRFVRGHDQMAWEIAGEETVCESPEWKWAAHATHDRQSILSCRCVTYTGIGEPVYIRDDSYFARDAHNTRWEGEQSHDRIQGPYPTRDAAMAALEAMAAD
jgi:hypothetical protein